MHKSRAFGKEPGSSVAVILPTYNREKFLPNALSVLLNQTVSPSQLVVVIDGSTDGSRRIVDDFSRNAPFEVTVCENVENFGIGFSRQVGAEKVRNDVDHVSYISDDDKWHPRFIERMLNHAKPDQITYCYYEVADQISGKTSPPFRFPTFKTREEFPRDAISWSMKPSMFVNFSSIMIPRTILRRVEFRKDFRKGEDLAFLLDSLCQGVEYQCLEEVLVTVGVHRGQVSFDWRIEDMRKLVRYVIRSLRQMGVSNELILYGMRDALEWARMIVDPISRIHQLIIPLLLRPPPTRRVAQFILFHRRKRRTRRIRERLEATRFTIRSPSGSNVLTESIATDE